MHVYRHISSIGLLILESYIICITICIYIDICIKYRLLILESYIHVHIHTHELLYYLIMYIQYTIYINYIKYRLIYVHIHAYLSCYTILDNVYTVCIYQV